MSGTRKVTDAIKAYSIEEISNAIVEVRLSNKPDDLEMYAKKWLRLDNDAVLTAIVENVSAPYKAIKLIVDKRWYSLEMLKAAYRHKNTEPELKKKIGKKLDENVEPTSHAFLPT